MWVRGTHHRVRQRRLGARREVRQCGRWRLFGLRRLCCHRLGGHGCWSWHVGFGLCRHLLGIGGRVRGQRRDGCGICFCALRLRCVRLRISGRRRLGLIRLPYSL